MSIFTLSSLLVPRKGSAPDCLSCYLHQEFLGREESVTLASSWEQRRALHTWGFVRGCCSEVCQ